MLRATTPSPHSHTHVCVCVCVCVYAYARGYHSKPSYDRVQTCVVRAWKRRCTCAQNARHYGNFSLDNGCTQPCCTKMRRMQRLHTGRQMFGVALGCSSLLPRLECTWGKIVIIIKFRLVCLILRVAGPRGYFYVSSRPPCRGHCRAVPGRKRVELHPRSGRASERASG